MKKITFIIPCYNCEQFIIQNYFRLKKKILSAEIKYKIYYINDGSADLTLKKLYLIKDKNVKIINNNINLGKSASIIKALKFVKKNFIIYFVSIKNFKALIISDVIFFIFIAG